MHKKRKSAVVVDFDNTLFFTDRCAVAAAKEITGKPMTIESIRALPKKKKHEIYRLGFAKYYRFSKPNLKMIDRLSRISHNPETGKIILLSAKPIADRERIQSLLDSQGVRIDSFIFRPKKYLFKHDEEWKLSKMEKLSEKYDTIDIYEDKADNISHIRDGLGSDKAKYFLVSKNSIRQLYKSG